MPLLQFTHVDSFFNWRRGGYCVQLPYWSQTSECGNVWSGNIQTYLNRFDQRDNPEWETAADESKQSQSQKVPRRGWSLTSFSSSPTTVTDVHHVLSRGLERRNVNSSYYPIGKWLHEWRYTYLGLVGKYHNYYEKQACSPFFTPWFVLTVQYCSSTFMYYCAHSTILLFHLHVLLWTQTEK